jgi:hypothetical protein
LIEEHRVRASLRASDLPIHENSLELPRPEREPYPVALTPAPYRKREVELRRIETAQVSIRSQLVVRCAELPAHLPTRTSDHRQTRGRARLADHQLLIESRRVRRWPLDDDTIELTAHDDAAGEINGTPA